MKIIGSTEGGYILESSVDEVARLLGYYSAYAKTPSGLNLQHLKPGTELQVDKIYDRIASLRAGQELAGKKAKDLRALADLLDGALEEPVPPSIAVAEPDRG